MSIAKCADQYFGGSAFAHGTYGLKKWNIHKCAKLDPAGCDNSTPKSFRVVFRNIDLNPLNSFSLFLLLLFFFFCG